jgi:hypothetical protein
MGSANLFHTFDGEKMAQTQQHTGVAVLETVSMRETLFHLCAK